MHLQSFATLVGYISGGVWFGGVGPQPEKMVGELYDWGQSLHLCSLSAHKDDPPIWEEVENRNIVNRLLAADYRSRCPRLNLDHRWRRHVCGRTHRRWDLRHWRHCVFSDESRFMLFQSDDCARVCHRHGEKLTDACSQHTDINHCPSVMVWGTTMLGGVNWWCWKDPSTGNVTSSFSVIMCFTGWLVCSDEPLCMSTTMLRPSKWHDSISGTAGCGGQLRGQIRVQAWTLLNMFGAK